MPRLALRASIVMLSSILLASPSVGQEPPRPARTVSGGWEYGILEIAQSGRGDAFVFCRFTADGCTETVLAVRPLPTTRGPSIPAETRYGAYDVFTARVISTLGREGWELVIETGFGLHGRTAPVLLFKRPGLR